MNELTVNFDDAEYYIIEENTKDGENVYAQMYSKKEYTLAGAVDHYYQHHWGFNLDKASNFTVDEAGNLDFTEDFE